MKILNNLALSSLLLFSACMNQDIASLKLADQNASLTTVKLLTRMHELSKQGIMFGHQDDLAYGIGWKSPDGQSDVFRVCSDYPAIFGWDLADIETGSQYNIDSVPFGEMMKFAIKIHDQGGINTFSWHANNPLTGGNAWDVNTPGVVKSILPGGSKHDEYTMRLDKLAIFFSNLKDANGICIPVIFRPFHEQTGNWFWWGKSHCSAEECITLWKYTFTYLTQTKNIHNLIYAFSTADSFNTTVEFSDRYPGDAYVDIVGFDIYQQPKQTSEAFAGNLKAKLKILSEFANVNKKLPAITEIGYEQIPDPGWWTDVFYQSVKDTRLSYALFWRNAANRPNHYYVPYPRQISEENFRKFCDLPETLFLKDI